MCFILLNGHNSSMTWDYIIIHFYIQDNGYLIGEEDNLFNDIQLEIRRDGTLSRFV